MPKSDKEVQDAVKCAAESKLTVSVKPGGHSYEGYWQGEKGGMVINLRQIKQIDIDCESKTVSVGAGSLLGPVIAELWKVKGVLPHGLQPQIGMGGQTLGGGFGLLSRKYGLLVDRVVEMTVVTSDGKSRVVSKDKDGDLFFALRGAGGGSYGVVTQFKYKYIEMARNLTVVRFNWNTDACNFTTVLGSIIKYYNSNPTRGATHYLSLSPGGQIELGVTYSNKKRETHKQAIQALEKIVTPPTTKDEQYLNFINAFLFYAGLAGKPSSSDVNGLAATKSETDQRFFKGRSGFLDKSKQLTEKTMEALADLLTPAGSNLFVLIDLWGGNIEKVKDFSFVHRDIFASVQIGATSENTLSLADNVHRHCSLTSRVLTRTTLT
ncbi:hypothetical protein DSO57_1021139 [Entomophthora muscae]|uniref:Uncharacterized protein n=1 Tax=Entomophthora muscae TaxID=34485 RepID=A0ACC2S5F1_9FUNG|nr:hypothetical protein DSO57_1021139 [Entomophthora muscae]